MNSAADHDLIWFRVTIEISRSTQALIRETAFLSFSEKNQTAEAISPRLRYIRACPAG
jgi:hypothetical protein